MEVWRPTREELSQARADLLVRSRHTEADLYRLGADYDLTHNERLIYEGIRSLDWLLRLVA